MQAKIDLSQVEKLMFVSLAEMGGARAALMALLAYKGIANAALAEALGVSPSMVSHMKSGWKISNPCFRKMRDLGVPDPLLPRPVAEPDEQKAA